jgi:cytochrome c-type biogenesis protein CcmH/NrfG
MGAVVPYMRDSRKTHASQLRHGRRACAAARQAGLARVAWTKLPCRKGIGRNLRLLALSQGRTEAPSASDGAPPAVRRVPPPTAVTRIRHCLFASLLLSIHPRLADSAPKSDSVPQASAAVSESDEELARKIPLLEAQIARHPEAGETWRELGWIHWRLGNLDQARRVWETWRRLDDTAAEAHALVGRLELRENRLTEAIRSFRRSLQLDANQQEILFALAKTLRWTGHLEESVRRLRQLLEKEPNSFEIRLELARALSSNWEYREALPLWAQLRTEKPDDTEIVMGEAQALLHTGSPRLALLNARRIHAADPENRQALTLLADEAEFGGRPAEAAHWVEQMAANAANDEERVFLRNRLLTLRHRIRETQPSSEQLARQTELARAILADAPRNPDTHMTLAYLLIEQGRTDEAENILIGVLREFNRNHLHARLALFELALQRENFAAARRHLEKVRSFHPQDPYLNWYEARRLERAGESGGAAAALDRLAAAGDRGAAAVLLYHALAPGDYGPALPVGRFVEHLRALMRAGYTFVTPEEMHAHWERHGPRAGRTADGRLRRVVAITFDDALESSLRFGTEIARSFGLRFALYIPVGYIEREKPYIAPWETLQRYAGSGVWEFGSHMHYGHDRLPVGREGAYGRALAVRQRLNEENRLESTQEYAERVRREYEHARAQIRSRLKQPCRAVAYPYGDIGQESVSNEPEAARINRHHAARHHDLGFIQTPFAHAVRGADPLLYGRHEINPHWSGERAVQHLLDRHPLVLAERTKLAFAQARGRGSAARHALQRLAALGYPEPALDELETALIRDMPPAFAPPVALPAEDRTTAYSPWTGGVTLTAFQDRLRAQQLRLAAYGAHPLAAGVHLAAHVGVGRLRQDDGGESFALSETVAKLELSAVDSRRRIWNSEYLSSYDSETGAKRREVASPPWTPALLLDVFADVLLAAGYRAKGRDQFFVGPVFTNIAAGAGTEYGLGEMFAGVVGKHHYASPVIVFPQRLGGGDSVYSRHRDIHDNDVGLKLFGQAYTRFAVFRLAHDVQVGVFLDQRGHLLAGRLVIVYKHDIHLFLALFLYLRNLREIASADKRVNPEFDVLKTRDPSGELGFFASRSHGYADCHNARRASMVAAMVTRSLHTKADVPDIGDADFQAVAEDAKNHCPVSKALAGCEILLDARLL